MTKADPQVSPCVCARARVRVTLGLLGLPFHPCDVSRQVSQAESHTCPSLQIIIHDTHTVRTQCGIKGCPACARARAVTGGIRVSLGDAVKGKQGGLFVSRKRKVVPKKGAKVLLRAKGGGGE